MKTIGLATLMMVGSLLCVHAAGKRTGAKGKTGASKMTPMKMEMEVTVTMKQGMPGPGGPGKPGGPAKPGAVPAGPMKITQTHWMKSESRMRIEQTMPMMGKVVSIVDGENIYVLNETQKTAQKMTMSSASAMAKTMGKSMGFGGMVGGAGSGMGDPAQMREQLDKMGFKKASTEKVGTETCDVYKGKIGEGQFGMEMTMWLRQSDHLPAKMVGGNAMMDMSAELKKVEKNPPMPDSLFKVPADYQIQDISAQMGKAMEKAKQAVGQSACLSNMKNLALAIRMYASDHSDKLPDYKKLEQELKPYLKNENLWKGCPAAGGKTPQYRMSSKCAGALKSIADPAGTILLFECDPKGRPVYRHGDVICLAFVDGHCKFYGKGSVTPGMWTPQAGD